MAERLCKRRKPHERGQDHLGLEGPKREGPVCFRTAKAEGIMKSSCLVGKARLLVTASTKSNTTGRITRPLLHDGPLEQIVGIDVLRFGEKEVEYNDFRALFAQAVHDPAPDGTGPGKTAQFVDALFVNSGNDRFRSGRNRTAEPETHVQRLLLQDLKERRSSRDA